MSLKAGIRQTFELAKVCQEVESSLKQNTENALISEVLTNFAFDLKLVQDMVRKHFLKNFTSHKAVLNFDILFVLSILFICYELYNFSWNV